MSPTDPQELADKMKLLLSNDDLRNEMSKNALERIQMFNIKETARKTQEIYEQIS